MNLFNKVCDALGMDPAKLEASSEALLSSCVEGTQKKVLVNEGLVVSGVYRKELLACCRLILAPNSDYGGLYSDSAFLNARLLTERSQIFLKIESAAAVKVNSECVAQIRPHQAFGFRNPNDQIAEIELTIFGPPPD